MKALEINNAAMRIGILIISRVLFIILPKTRLKYTIFKLVILCQHKIFPQAQFKRLHMRTVIMEHMPPHTVFTAIAPVTGVQNIPF